MDGSPGTSPRKSMRSPLRNNGRVGVGVSVDTRPGGKVYKVRVYHKGKCLNLGRFSDLLKAQLSYDQAVWAMSCQGAKKVKTNFPVGTYPLDDADVQRKVQDFMAGLAATSTAEAATAAGHQAGAPQLQLPNSPSSSSAGEDITEAAAADDADNWARCSGAAGAAGAPLAAPAPACDDDNAFQQLLQLVPRDSLQYCSTELHRLLLQQQQLGAVPAAAAVSAEPQQAQPCFAGLLQEDELQLAADFGPFHEAARRTKSALCAAPSRHGGLALPACTGRAFSCSALAPRSFGMPVHPGSSMQMAAQAGEQFPLPLAAQAGQQLPLLCQPSLVVQDAKKRRLDEGDVSKDTHQQQPKIEEEEEQQQQQGRVDDELELTLSNELLGLGLGLTHSMGSLMLTHSLEVLMNGEPLVASQQLQTPAVARVEAAAPCAATDAPDAAPKTTQGSSGSLSNGADSPAAAAPGSGGMAGPPRDTALQLIGETVRGLLEMNVALLRGTQTCALRDALMWLSSYRQKRAGGGSSSSLADRAALQLMGQVVQLLAQEASAADSGSSPGLAAFVERPTALSAVERLLVALTGLNELIRAAAGPSVCPVLLHGWLSGLQDQATSPADAVVAQVASQLHQELMATV